MAMSWPMESVSTRWSRRRRPVPGEPVPDDAARLRAVNARLRVVVEAKDPGIAVLRAEQDADREALRLTGLQVAELQRRLGMDSSDSGTPLPTRPR
jgi:hypothetical protein